MWEQYSHFEVNEVLLYDSHSFHWFTSEEIFDYSSGEMTKAKIKHLKQQFNKEFSLIYQLYGCIVLWDAYIEPAVNTS